MNGDSIIIRDLVVETRIGWTEAERSSPRPVRITIALEVDLGRAGATDDLGDTVDYGSLTEDVAELVRGAETRLLEHLASEIARLCTRRPGVGAASVEVEKGDPPIDEEVRAVAVRIRRGETGGM